jgi:lysophospholipase L1-like esterase
MAKPIENNDNAKEFWENLSDAAALDSETKTALTTLIGAETPAAVDAKIATVLPPTQINPGTITAIAFAGDSFTSDTKVTTAVGAKFSSYLGGWPHVALSICDRDITKIQGGSNENFSASGYRAANWLATSVPELVALATKPSHVITMIGKNDVRNDVPIQNFLADLTTGAAALVASGMTPIFTTVPPDHPYCGDARQTSAGLYAAITARYNEALYDWCAEHRYRLIDLRELEKPDEPGAIHRGSFDEGDLLGLHAREGWNWRAGEIVARTLREYGTADSHFDVAGVTVLNPHPNWTATPTVSNPTYQTISNLGTETRLDGLAGNLLRFDVTHTATTTKEIGSGNTGFVFTPVAPNKVWDFDVRLVFAQSFTPGSTSPDTTPVIAVVPIVGTNRKLVLVKPKTNGSFVSLTTCQEIIDTLNAHPEVSALFTTASSGTPGSNVPPLATPSTFPAASFNTAVSATVEDIDDTDLVRGVAEIWLPRGSYNVGCFLRGRPLYGNSGSGFPSGSISVLASHSVSSGIQPLPAPYGRIIYRTPWVVAGDYRAFYLGLSFGGAEGRVFVGRTQIQARTP